MATIAVMLATALFSALFFWQFGSLRVEQLSALIDSIPSLTGQLLAQINERFGTTYTTENPLASLG